MNLKALTKQRDTLLQKLINLLQNQMAKSLQERTLLHFCTQALGTDVTPDDLVPDKVACAITVSTLIHKVDQTFPKVAGTWTLYDILEHRRDYMRVTLPSAETIIVCPTVPGRPFPGHTGIFLDNNRIASNDSATGKFMQNYTLETWIARYVDKGGYQVFMYKKR